MSRRFLLTGKNSTTIAPIASIIQSIQEIEITIPISSSSATATISSVNTANTIILYNGIRGGDTDVSPATNFISLAITNSTTITATTFQNNTSFSRTICATVIEFVSTAVVSVQTGTIAVTGTSGTATISTVNTARSAVIFGGEIDSQTAQQYGRVVGSLTLTNNTTVMCTREAASGTLTVRYFVIEFSSSVINSIQQTNITIPISSSSATATISNVNTANCLLLYGGWSLGLALSTSEADMPYAKLTNGTTVTAIRTSSNATATSIITATVVEFKAQIIKTRQTGQTAIANASGTNVAISGVNTNKTAISWLGQTYDTDGTPFNAMFATAKLTTSTNLSIDRGASIANTLIISWEIVEFY